jgi:serine-type D-Ala-D-Ala carboxypeptidase (penicillin-binding protein 5/6)
MALRVRIYSLLLVACFGATLAAPSSAVAATHKVAGPAIYARAAIVVSSDGAVLWAKNADKPRRIASTTKMLTALVVMDHLRLDDVITVAPKAEAVDDGAVGLKAGRKLTVRQLLAVMLVHSANGAAEALAIGVAGSEKKFVKMMDAKARALGCKHTHPADPHGLSPKGVSTAWDLSVISRRLMADDTLRSIVIQRSAWLPWGGYSATDKLIGNYSGLEGIKTGYTDPAGYCFTSAAKRGDVELFGVILGADTPEARFSETRRLLDWGFAHAATRQLVSRDDTMGCVEVRDGSAQTVTVHPGAPISMVALSGGSTGLSTQVSLLATVAAPVASGQQLGEVQVCYHGSVLSTAPLVADVPVDRARPAPVAAFAQGVARVASHPGFWSSLAHAWAGLGKMLGI